MKKRFLSILITLGILITSSLLFVFILEDYLSKIFKQDIELKKISLYPFKLETSSLGGNTVLRYKDNTFILKLKDVKLSSFEKINKTKTRKTMIIAAGDVSGEITYNPFTNTYLTDLQATNTRINGINLDRKLLFYNDVLGFNIISLFKNYLKNIDTTKKITEVPNLQFNARMDNNIITLSDTTISTKNFRITFIGKLYKEGNIIDFKAHLVDRNGCSIISQELTGNLRDPKIKKTKTITKVIKKVPTSMFSTGMKMAKFTRHNIEAVMPNNKRHISRKLISHTNIIFKKTAKIVMPQNCQVIYAGKVAHPKFDLIGLIE